MSTPKWELTDVTRRTSVELLLKEPFYAEMYYSFYVYKMPAGFNAPHPDTLATDEVNLWVYEPFFKALSPGLRKSSLIHEILHKVLHHGTRRGQRDPTLWNEAADECVNELMVDAGYEISPDWVQPNPDRKKWSVERRYDAMLKEQQAQSGASDPNHPFGKPRTPPKGMMYDVRDTPVSSQEAAARHEELVQQAVDRALNTAKAAGQTPKGIEQESRKVWQPAEEPWYNHLHRYAQELIMGQRSWSKFDRRMMLCHNVFAPSFMQTALGPVIVGRDTSGSMYSKGIQFRIMQHVQAIMAEAKPRTLTMLDFDAKIQQVSDFLRGDDDIMTNAKGGGGTDFRPVFDWIDENVPAPAVLIMITDTYGTFPQQEPDYPVIWACTESNTHVPFGEAIQVK